MAALTSGGRKMRRRLRKKRHREFLTTICAWVVTFDHRLRENLLRSKPGTAFDVDGACSAWVQRDIRKHGLRYRVALAHKLAPGTAYADYWAAEFPMVRDQCLIFSAADLELEDVFPVA